jgi:hypothetical protein
MPQQKGCLTVIQHLLFEHKLPYEARSSDYRRFRAKPCKKFVDGQAASPSSWKMPRIAP